MSRTVNVPPGFDSPSSLRSALRPAAGASLTGTTKHKAATSWLELRKAGRRCTTSASCLITRGVSSVWGKCRARGTEAPGVGVRCDNGPLSHS